MSVEGKERRKKNNRKEKKACEIIALVKATVERRRIPTLYSNYVFPPNVSYPLKQEIKDGKEKKNRK